VAFPPETLAHFREVALAEAVKLQLGLCCCKPRFPGYPMPYAEPETAADADYPYPYPRIHPFPGGHCWSSPEDMHADVRKSADVFYAWLRGTASITITPSPPVPE
jgi:hypothetical protein